MPQKSSAKHTLGNRLQKPTKKHRAIKAGKASVCGKGYHTPS